MGDLSIIRTYSSSWHGWGFWVARWRNSFPHSLPVTNFKQALVCHITNGRICIHVTSAVVLFIPNYARCHPSAQLNERPLVPPLVSGTIERSSKPIVPGCQRLSLRWEWRDQARMQAVLLTWLPLDIVVFIQWVWLIPAPKLVKYVEEDNSPKMAVTHPSWARLSAGGLLSYVSLC